MISGLVLSFRRFGSYGGQREEGANARVAVGPQVARHVRHMTFMHVGSSESFNVSLQQYVNLRQVSGEKQYNV